MKLAPAFLALTALVGFAVAAPAPNPVEIAPRCGTTYYPTIMQQLAEDVPTVVGANTKNFHVQRVVSPSGRTDPSSSLPLTA